MLILHDDEKEEIEAQLGRLLKLFNEFEGRSSLAINDSRHLKDLQTCCTISAQLIIKLYQRLGGITPKDNDTA